MQGHLASYRRTQIETATPLQRVVLLYDGAIDACRRAAEAIAGKKLEEKARAVDKSLAILGELQGSLNLEQGGEIAARLNALYTYMCEQIVESSVRLDAERLGHVVKLLETLRSAWHEIATRPADAPSVGAAPPVGVGAGPAEPRLSVTT